MKGGERKGEVKTGKWKEREKRAEMRGKEGDRGKRRGEEKERKGGSEERRGDLSVLLLPLIIWLRSDSVSIALLTHAHK